MTKRMLIDAAHAEETRVAVVDGARVEEFDFESRAKAAQGRAHGEQTPEPDADASRQSPAHASPTDQGLRHRSLNPLSTKARSKTVK